MNSNASSAAAQADFAACTDPAALENAKARYLGKAGALTELLKSLGKLSAAERPAAGARINAAKVDAGGGARCAARRARRGEARGAARGRSARRVAARARRRSRRTASGHAHARADGIAVPLARLRGRRRPRNRGRLPQLHRAQHAGEPSGAVDARHVLRRRRPRAAHAHLAHPGAVHGNARAADQDHRAGPRLSRRQRCHAFADVPSGRGPVDRRGRLVRGPEGRGRRVPAPASSSATTSRCASARRSSRSPSRRPRST